LAELRLRGRPAAGGVGGAQTGARARAGIGVCANGASSTCASCKPGWQGANCDACTQSSVCQAASGSGAASCNTQFAYTAHTAYKSYVCDVSATILSNFLAPSRGFWINCNTTRPANSEGGYCRLGLRLKDQPNNPLQCVASDCAFKDGSAEVQCKTTACSCATPDASGNCGPPGVRPALTLTSINVSYLHVLQRLVVAPRHARQRGAPHARAV